jgi:hypothetical protein
MSDRLDQVQAQAGPLLSPLKFVFESHESLKNPSSIAHGNSLAVIFDQQLQFI